MKTQKSANDKNKYNIFILVAITALLCTAIVCVAFFWYPPLQQTIPMDTGQPFLPALADGQDAATVNINTAGVPELTLLPGIGAVKARAIIEYREANGPFASIEQLLEVSGIGPKTLEALVGLVSV